MFENSYSWGGGGWYIVREMKFIRVWIRILGLFFVDCVVFGQSD